MKLRCTYDKAELVFRSPQKDRRGFLRIACPKCGRNFKASEGEFSHPFEVRPRKDPKLVRVPVSGRREQYWLDAVKKKHGSFQKWLDKQSLP